MTNNSEGIKKAMETQEDKYGGKEGLSREMARRASMRLTHGTGGFKTLKETGQTERLKELSRAGVEAKRKKNAHRTRRPAADTK
jgi:hypothetical protein